ncbi:MAG TPA: hypothetical protein VM165_20760 [Planctomycetaceae bacterium]|nr:hypothetical protein [Planctomycetaceae bacterium]
MDRLGLAVSGAAFLAGLALIAALCFAPNAAFAHFDRPHIKAYLSAAILLVCIGGGIFVYWLFHRPPPYRFLIWVFGFVFSGFSASMAGPFLANIVEGASLSHVKSTATDAGQQIDAEEWNAKLARASYDAWDACVLVSGMLFSGIFGVKLFDRYFRLARYEKKHGALNL